MPSRNKPLKGLLGLVPLVSLAACVGGPSPSAGSGPVVAASSAVQAAICEGRGTDAVALLSAEPLAAPSDRFYTALAYEESGQPVHARQIYAELMSAGYQGNVSIRCGGAYLANGSIRDEAGRHLARIAQTLQSMDVAMAPSVRLSDGLPSMGQTTAVKHTVAQKTTNHGTKTVTRPETQSPLGRWFVHLASYRSVEHAKENKPTLEKEFPALAGVLDQWEVDVHGFAIRLGVRLNDHQEAEALCSSIKAQGAYCAVLDTQK